MVSMDMSKKQLIEMTVVKSTSKVSGLFFNYILTLWFLTMDLVFTVFCFQYVVSSEQKVGSWSTDFRVS